MKRLKGRDHPVATQRRHSNKFSLRRTLSICFRFVQFRRPRTSSLDSFSSSIRKSTARSLVTDSRSSKILSYARSTTTLERMIAVFFQALRIRMAFRNEHGGDCFLTSFLVHLQVENEFPCVFRPVSEPSGESVRTLHRSEIPKDKNHFQVHLSVHVSPSDSHPRILSVSFPRIQASPFFEHSFPLIDSPIRLRTRLNDQFTSNYIYVLIIYIYVLLINNNDMCYIY